MPRDCSKVALIPKGLFRLPEVADPVRIATESGTAASPFASPWAGVGACSWLATAGASSATACGAARPATAIASTQATTRRNNVFISSLSAGKGPAIGAS